jgi:hypothetical protein
MTMAVQILPVAAPASPGAEAPPPVGGFAAALAAAAGPSAPGSPAGDAEVTEAAAEVDESLDGAAGADETAAATVAAAAASTPVQAAVSGQVPGTIGPAAAADGTMPTPGDDLTGAAVSTAPGAHGRLRAMARGGVAALGDPSLAPGHQLRGGPAVDASAPAGEPAADATSISTSPQTSADEPAGSSPDVVAAVGAHAPGGSAASSTDATMRPLGADRVAGPVGSQPELHRAAPAQPAVVPVEAQDVAAVEAHVGRVATAPARAAEVVEQVVPTNDAQQDTGQVAATIDDITRVEAPSTVAGARGTDALASRVAARVEEAVRALENAPPPRDVTLEVDGLILHVRMRGDMVRVIGDGLLPRGWEADLRPSLEARGFDLATGGDESGPDRDRAGRERRDDVPPDTSSLPLRRTASRDADDLRI